MIESPVREAPADALLQSGGLNPERPDEPVLAVKNIQGNIAGFNKDHQRLLFLQISDVDQFREALKAIVPSIASVEEVLHFNRLFKEIRSRRGRECPTLQATWINVAFSFAGLEKLGPPRLSSFTDRAFRQGMGVSTDGSPSRAVTILGDNAVPTPGSSHPSLWKVGGEPSNNPDAVFIVAGDDEGDVQSEVEWLKNLLQNSSTSILEDFGATLPAPLTGHEHFGFLDGVSQPGLKGRISEHPSDLFTPRQNPANPDQGKPGQDCLWPGEFIFGYPRQDPADANKAGPNSMKDGAGAPAVPYWAKDGSYLVFRRLRQRVGAFHGFVKQAAGAHGLAPAALGAKMVGRWTSGAPIERAVVSDKPVLGNNDCANNNFDFQEDTDGILEAGPGQCLDDIFAPANADSDGSVCPFAAHIRKAYPRDDVSTANPSGPPNEADTESHRLLRRGIPFGAPLAGSTMEDPAPEDEADRGLLFLAYQTSFERQFEFVIQSWVNAPDFKDPAAGHDPILGQANTVTPSPYDGVPSDNRTRHFRLTPTDAGSDVTLPEDWIVATGGAYLFAPSIEGLQLLSRPPQ